MGRPRKYTRNQLDAAVISWVDGTGTVRAVACAHGIGYRTLLTAIREAGFTPDPRRYKYPRGKEHWSWSGGRYTTPQGYVAVQLDAHSPYLPMAQSSSTRRGASYALEHRLVVAEQLGRLLSDQEEVHHLNGDRADNRPQNLQLRTKHHGRGSVFVCGDCGSHNIIPQEIGD